MRRKAKQLKKRYYYWLRLKDDFFKQKQIKKLRRIAGGDTYTIIYLKMLLSAIKQDNKLYFEGVEENFHEELALELDEEPENVKITLSFLERQGLLQVFSEDEFFLIQCEEMVGKETDSAARVRKHREIKTLQSNTSVTQQLQKGNTDIDIDIDINKYISCASTAAPVEKVQRDDTREKDFEKIYAIYPKKRGKAKAFEYYCGFVGKGRILNGIKRKLTSDQIYSAVDRYVKQQELAGTELNYYKNFDTLMNKPIVDYLDQNYEHQPIKNSQSAHKNRFHNFEQRSTDYNNLVQQQLLERLAKSQEIPEE